MLSYQITAWLSFILRWAHIFAAILWIGQTYLFNRLERCLETEPDQPAHVIGKLWMVHGGGFFFVEKQNFPKQYPDVLHWFKWEAGMTWITGALLLGLTYYHGGLLIEPEQDFTLAAGVGIGTILVGWFVYDLLAQSRYLKNEVLFGLLALCAFIAAAFYLPQVMSARAAYIHVGALIGTIMAANVWMRIIPAMKKTIAISKKGKDPDLELLEVGPRRSKHNSYLVAPLLFIMISNHYPVISYGHEYSYLVVGALIIGGWIFAKIMKG